MRAARSYVAGVASFCVASLCFASSLPAQCPDGSPPPCGRAAALDENRWIVVPFQNVARAPDAEWLGNASVNLLYLNLSQWRDLRVVDDERVADLLRSRGSAPLGLNDAIALARRVRAGKVVMGDLLKVGNTLTVVGKVYRTSNSQRVRQVSVDVPSPDSVFTSYRRLASLLLDLPAPDARASIGTTSLDAYRDYVRGVLAMRSWVLDSAENALRRAIAADTAFALAHYQLARTIGWARGTDTTAALEAGLAVRLGAGLPERERTLFSANVDFEAGRFESAAGAYRALIRRDSTDAEAWYGLGETEFHNEVVRTEGAHPAFAGSWNTALAAFRRVLALDPSYHLAYGHIADIHTGAYRYGCNHLTPGSFLCSARDYLAVIRLDGDTLATIPRPLSQPQDSFEVDLTAAARSGLEAHNRRALRDAAAAWVQSGPGEPDAHLAYAEALVRAGDPQSASRELGFVTRPARRSRAIDVMRLRAEVALKVGRYAEAAAIADSLFALPLGRGGDPGNGLNALLGRFQRWGQRTYPGWPAEVHNAYDATVRTVAGVPPATLPDAEAGYIRVASADTAFHADRPRDRLTALLLTVSFGMPNRPRAGLPADTSPGVPVFLRLASARVLSDTAATRRFAAELEHGPDDGLVSPDMVQLQLAEAYREIADTAAARRVLARLETEVFPSAPLDGGDASVYSGEPAVWGRAFLLQGDLAAAQHDQATAIRAYGRVVGIWGTADPELQPAVARARAALAAAGATP